MALRDIHELSYEDIALRLNDWVGVDADYRTFFVHRDIDASRPSVHDWSDVLAEIVS